MRPRGHVRYLAFGDRGHVKCEMGPKQSLEGVLFGLKSPCLRGVPRHVLGLQCHPSGCRFWLGWFLWINGTGGTCQRSRFGDGGHTRCSMGPNQSLERVFFSLKSPYLMGFSGTFLASNVTQVTVISAWNDSCGSMGPKGHIGHLASVIGSMPSPQWDPNSGWRWSFFPGKSPCWEGDSVATFGIHSHLSDCNLKF